MLSVGTAGASSSWLSSHKVKLSCTRKKQLKHVGYIIFKVGTPSLCDVISVTGEAINSASEYASAT